MAKSDRRSEQAGLFHFAREMISALIMALIFIVYVIQAFKIPTGSMENSLLVGDFLLGLKFIYGSPIVPFSYKKIPGLSSPKPGDVVIFEYPGNDFEYNKNSFKNADYIKRCVAGPGQVIESKGTSLLVDGRAFKLPPKGKYILNGRLDFPGIVNFAPLRVPKKGDTIRVDSLSVRDFLFLRNLVEQENPGSRFAKFMKTVQPFWKGASPEGPVKGTTFSNVKIDFTLFVDGACADTLQVMVPTDYNQSFSLPFKRFVHQYPIDRITTWIELQNFMDFLAEAVNKSAPGRTYEIRRELYLSGSRISSYTVKYDNYFMMGDNRDNSMDSRYWGYLNRNYVKAKAFILYFSLDNNLPVWQLPIKIRWNRIGKLIKSWDGLHK